MRFSNRVVIVTGAAGAIGAATVRAFAREDASLSLIDKQSTKSFATDLRAAGVRAASIEVDVTDSSQVQAAVGEVLDIFGRVDVLVNVAGVVSHGAAEHLSEEEWDRVLAVNLKGAFLCCRSVIPPMRAQHYGRILNIGSVTGKSGGNARPWLDREEQEQAANIAYGVSKAGVHAMTLYLAKELAADGITVNAVAPGPIATEMTTTFPDSLKQLIPVGRMGTVEDVAEAILFLAAEGSDYITGEIMDINGGLWVD